MRLHKLIGHSFPAITLAMGVLGLTAFVTVQSISAAAPPADAKQVSNPRKTENKFEKEIAAFEAADHKSPPPQGAVLFIGDSGFKKWTSMADDFPDQKVINRGFGGSQMSDAVFFMDRIVLPYNPRVIILREGGNDLTSGKTIEQILADIQTFITKVHVKLPDTRIAIFSFNPNPARWNQAEKRKAANIQLKAFVESQRNVQYIEVWDQFLGSDGKPREDLFIQDRLHNNAAGNRIYADAVRPFLK